MSNSNYRKPTSSFVVALFLFFAGANAVWAQGTAFTYQGKLADNGTPANGAFDLQFKLFDNATVGTGSQQGSTITQSSVQVASGIFTVQLDFGACGSCFNGANRFLEISVKPTGGSTFTTLSPRQPITSTPYTIKSLSAATADGLSVTCVSCVTSSQIQSVNGSAVSGAIPMASVPPGSGNYIQNTTSPQASSNFNISGNGVLGGTLTANTVNVNAGGLTLNDNLLRLRGANDPNHGILWSTEVDGPEFRAFSGFRWQNGSGVLTERMRLDGSGNLTVGGTLSATTVSGFFVNAVGEYKIAGNRVLHLDFGGGAPNLVIGGAKVAIGLGTPAINYKLQVHDTSNTGLRVQTDISGGTVASFGGSGDFQIDAPGIVGGRFVVKESGNVGIGTVSPTFKLHVEDSGNAGLRVGSSTPGGAVASFGPFGTFEIDAPNIPGGRFVVKENGFVGIGWANPSDRLDVNGFIRFNSLGAAGSSTLCRNSLFQISSCSSSLRYKTNIADWHSGLNLLNRLRPVTFDWKESKAHDLGLVAEEVAGVEPLLVTHNDKGEIEGVKYDRIGVVLINAIREQQSQIEALQKENLEMKARLALLERLVPQPRNH